MAGARGRRASPALAFSVALAVSVASLRAVFPSVSAFVGKIDDYRLLFADFVLQYHPAAQEILGTGRAYPGYYYPAFFAILLAPLGALPLPTALTVWGALQAATTALLASLAVRAARGVWLGAAAIVLVLTSAPVLHGIKWGQVSGMIVLLGLSGCFLAFQGRRTVGSFALALAAAIKIYPLAFLVVPLARRDGRFMVSFAVWLVLFVVAVPAAVLGIAGALQYQGDVHAGWRADAARHAADPNSQYFPNVVERWTLAAAGPFAPIDPAPTVRRRAFAATGFAVAGGIAILAGNAVARGVPHAAMWSGLLLFGAIPFAIPTAWPHYASHLPIAQAFAARELLRERSRRLRAMLSIALLLPSIGFGSILPIALGMKWRSYVYLGGPFVASLLALALLVALLLPKLRARGGGSGALTSSER